MVKKNDEYKCRFKGCKFNTLYLNALKAHLKGHSKLFRVQKEMKCIMIGCQWSGKQGSLRKHIRTKHPEEKDKTLRQIRDEQKKAFDCFLNPPQVVKVDKYISKDEAAKILDERKRRQIQIKNQDKEWKEKCKICFEKVREEHPIRDFTERAQCCFCKSLFHFQCIFKIPEIPLFSKCPTCRQEMIQSKKKGKKK